MNISIKNVPNSLVERLRHRAKRHHRSLQGELLDILEQTVQPRHLSVKEAAQKLQNLGLNTDDDAVEMIRQDRDGR